MCIRDSGKQLLGRTYDIKRPQVVAGYMTGRPHRGVGPQDVALAIIGAVFKKGYVKNKVMEFIGDGIANLNVEYRNGIDVMTTETTCLSSVWATDGQVEDYFEIHGRKEAYKRLAPGDAAYYDGVVHVDLSTVKPMIAMPFHPSNAYEIDELNANLMDILAEVEREGAKSIDNPAIHFTLRDKVKDGRLLVDQGVIAGCAGGTYDNICDAADIPVSYTHLDVYKRQAPPRARRTPGTRRPPAGSRKTPRRGRGCSARCGRTRSGRRSFPARAPPGPRP